MAHVNLKGKLREAVVQSRAVWQADLEFLFRNAKERHADIVWRISDEGSDGVVEIYGHRAIVNIRAPQPTEFFQFPNSVITALVPAGGELDHPDPLSVLSPNRIPPHDVATSDSKNPSLIPLIPEYTNQIEFSRALEYLYTAKGERDESLKKINPYNEEEGLSTLREDLCRLLKSRIFYDVRLSVIETDSSSVIVFHCHRCILASRSLYFHREFQSTHMAIVTLQLPLKDFTPASLQWALGFMYAGTLHFSGRKFDLETAFFIVRSSKYLLMTSMTAEIEAYIVEQMLHGLFNANLSSKDYESITAGEWGVGGCKCRECQRRMPRVLEFALDPDISNEVLERGSTRALVAMFGVAWCSREFAKLSNKIHSLLLRGVRERTPQNASVLLEAVEAALERLASKSTSIWGPTVQDLILEVRDTIAEVICDFAEDLFRQRGGLEIVDSLEAPSVDMTQVNMVMQSLIRCLGFANAARTYQTMLSILSPLAPIKLPAKLHSSQSPVRVHAEQTRLQILDWIKTHWRSIRLARGFNTVQPWVLEILGKELSIPQQDLLLLGPPTSTFRDESASDTDSTTAVFNFGLERVYLTKPLTRRMNNASRLRPIRPPRATTGGRSSVNKQALPSAAQSSDPAKPSETAPTAPFQPGSQQSENFVPNASSMDTKIREATPAAQPLRPLEPRASISLMPIPEGTIMNSFRGIMHREPVVAEEQVHINGEDAPDIEAEATNQYSTFPSSAIMATSATWNALAPPSVLGPGPPIPPTDSASSVMTIVSQYEASQLSTSPLLNHEELPVGANVRVPTGSVEDPSEANKYRLNSASELGHLTVSNMGVAVPPNSPEISNESSGLHEHSFDSLLGETRDMCLQPLGSSVSSSAAIVRLGTPSLIIPIGRRAGAIQQTPVSQNAEPPANLSSEEAGLIDTALTSPDQKLLNLAGVSDLIQAPANLWEPETPPRLEMAFAQPLSQMEPIDSSTALPPEKGSSGDTKSSNFTGAGEHNEFKAQVQNDRKNEDMAWSGKTTRSPVVSSTVTGAPSRGAASPSPPALFAAAHGPSLMLEVGASGSPEALISPSSPTARQETDQEAVTLNLIQPVSGDGNTDHVHSKPTAGENGYHGSFSDPIALPPWPPVLGITAAATPSSVDLPNDLEHSNAVPTLPEAAASPTFCFSLHRTDWTVEAGNRNDMKTEELDLNEDATAGNFEQPTLNLESLMIHHVPLDLSGQVVIPDRSSPAHGGIADVHAGLWNGEAVAVKILRIRRDRRADPDIEAANARRMKREMHVWAALKHRNVSEFLGYTTDFSDYPAMVSPWCGSGNTLEHMSSHVLTIHERIRLVKTMQAVLLGLSYFQTRDVSEGLKYLHNLKVVHGDMKPANVLVDDTGVARLCDFGLVRILDWEGPSGMTTTSPYTGTERYKAPELFVSRANRHPVATLEGDIYSLGSIMLEFIEEIIPFQRFKRNHDLRDAIMDGYSPALRSETKNALLNMTDLFWNLLDACWGEPTGRPTIGVVVNALGTYALEL